MTLRPCLALVLVCAASPTFANELSSELEGVVEGFQQILPRGRIAALVDPTFVAADDAELPDSAWVLGFELGGEAFAYDLNLLNTHEVVNHTAAGQPIAAVW